MPQLDGMLGMTPTTFRAGGDGRRDPLRRRRVLARARSWSRPPSRGVCAILLGDDPEALVRDLAGPLPAGAS